LKQKISYIYKHIIKAPNKANVLTPRQRAWDLKTALFVLRGANTNKMNRS